MDKIKVLLKNARLDAQMSCAGVARELDISRSSVSAWENPHRRATPSKENLTALAELYGRTVDSLVGHSSGNVTPGPDSMGAVPVLTIQSLRSGIRTAMATAENKGFIFCPVPHGPDTFAMRVEGRSMISTNPLEKSYPPGTVVYCDPGKAVVPKSGSMVIATLDDGTVVFKQYLQEDGREWLRPISAEYDAIRTPFTVTAVVIGSFHPE